MGIKGLYDEIRPDGEKSLAKLAADFWREKRRSLRVAVDAAIWSFQAQNAPGSSSSIIGPNHALKVIYYRIIMLWKLNIQAVFVFDGPCRPSFKRDKVVSTRENMLLTNMKKLVSLFGLPHHTAPGEAEAECAHLQKTGSVDAVISEDVDTLMFGCKMSFRVKTPTRVDVYDLDTIEKRDGITQAGMILIALLNGGDYNTSGVANCGIKIAAAAARAGYGERLIEACATSDSATALHKWREQLEKSIRTNCEGIFSRRSSRIRIPTSFPDQTVLRFYTQPIISEVLPIFDWKLAPKIDELYTLCSSIFEWDAKKFIKTIAEGLLSYQVINALTSEDDIQGKVLQLHSTRSHSSVDNEMEIRIEYRASEVVNIPYTPGLMEVRDELLESLDTLAEPTRVTKQLLHYDPQDPARAWFVLDYISAALPEKYSEYQELERTKIAKKGQRKPVKTLPSKRPSRQITDYFTATKTGNLMKESQLNKAKNATKVSQLSKHTEPPIKRPSVTVLDGAGNDLGLLDAITISSDGKVFDKTFDSQSLNLSSNLDIEAIIPQLISTETEMKVTTIDASISVRKVEHAVNESLKSNDKCLQMCLPKTDDTKVHERGGSVRLRESLPGFWAPAIGEAAQIREVVVLDLVD